MRPNGAGLYGKIPRCDEAAATTSLRKHLNRAWRAVATAAGFGVFGAGLVVIALTTVPYLNRTGKSEADRRRRMRSVVGRCNRAFIRFLALAGALEWQLSNWNRVPRRGPFVVAANHPTLLDAPILLGQLPQAECIAKRSLRRHWAYRRIIRAAGYLTNDDPIVLLDSAITRLKEGGTVLIFPEGTRISGGFPRATERGAAAMAVRAGCPIVPVTIRCEPATLSREHSWYHTPTEKVRLSLRVHRPMFADPTLNRREATAELHERMDTLFADEFGRAARAGRESDGEANLTSGGLSEVARQ